LVDRGNKIYCIVTIESQRQPALAGEGHSAHLIAAFFCTLSNKRKGYETLNKCLRISKAFVVYAVVGVPPGICADAAPTTSRQEKVLP
jgi:hypothetical protein